MTAGAQIRRVPLSTGATARRALAEEVPVALSFDGTTQAVMMASPLDLVDFAYGFALTEGLATPDEITAVEPVAVAGGIDLRIWLAAPAAGRLAARHRQMLGPVGCGLCGLDSLTQVLRPLPPVARGRPWLTVGGALAALAALGDHQPLHDATRAVHAAGWWTPTGMVTVREDVGRHNALDKLAGHLARQSLRGPGAVVLSSRVSLDLVQKVAAMGVGMLIAVSAPTVAAVDLARDLGITLLTAGGDGALALHAHPEHLLHEVADAV